MSELVSRWVSDPDSTLRWAASVLMARGSGAASRARAWHAAAVAHMERCEPDLARRAARRALPGAGPEVRLVLAWVEQDAGNPRASMRQLELAWPRLRGALLARARCLRGLNLCVAGEYGPAHRELTAAITGSRRHGDRHWLANALNGRGVVRLYLSRLPAADRDLAAAATLYAALGQGERAATCLHNRGCVALQAGDHAGALRLFDDAVRAGLRPGARTEAMIDRAHALMAAGLVTEAAEVLAQAANRLGARGRSRHLADAWLALARCATRADLALDAARRAAELFRRQRRTRWLTAAEAISLRLTLRPSAAPDARLLARRCVRHGFPVEAAELRLAVGDRDLLHLVQAHRFTGPPRLRALGWLARARLAALDGNRRALYAACRAGLRTGCAETTTDLTTTAVSAALEAADPAAALRWTGRVTPTELTKALGATALLTYLIRGAELLAVSLVDGQCRLHRLGRVPAGIDSLRFARTRDALARRIDQSLLAPLRPLLADRPLVIATEARQLLGLAWAALPTCAGRPVSVVPSAAAWLHANQLPSTVHKRLWVAGPGLRHADREVTALHRRWGGTLLTSRKSTVDAVRTAMAGADLVHIAAHGRHRPEAPLYSYLELADGPLFAHDLPKPPRLLILSACDAALSATLSPTTRALIASTAPIPDAPTVDLVTTLHEHLHSGATPAEALARAQTTHGDLGFICIGAG